MASADIEEILTRGDASSERAARWVRDLMIGGPFDFEERPRSGWQSVSFHHPEAGYVAGLFPRDKDALLVIEHGAALDGFDDVFDGGGKQVRNITVRDVPDPRAERIIDVLLAAIAFRLAR